MSIFKILSLVVVGLCLLIVHLIGAPKSSRSESYFLFIRFAPFLIPLVCIWFGDEMGAWVSGRVTMPSEGWAVRFMGWVLLILFFIGTIILEIKMKG
jgi:hypothetical protein